MKILQLFFIFVCMMMISITHVQSQQLWGLAFDGGNTYNAGSIVRMNPDGTNFHVAWNFSSPDGQNPVGDIIQGIDGMLYGTCFHGGDYSSCTIWRFNPENSYYEDIHDFDVTHGSQPNCGVVQADDGMIYGTTLNGGANEDGVLYSIDPVAGTYTDLYDFNEIEGAYPRSAPLIVNGILYGTTSFGNWINGFGMIYKFDPNNNLFEVLSIFNGFNGLEPWSGLILGNDSLLYGMTYQGGGGTNSDGVIYRFDPTTDSLMAIYVLDSTNGSHPFGNLMQATDGKLYGMTFDGGTNNLGVIFSFDLDSMKYTKLFDFNLADGRNPIGKLMQSGNILVGATTHGGNFDHGVAFNFDLITGIYTKVHDFTGAADGDYPSGGFVPVQAATSISQISNQAIAIFPNPVSGIAYCSISSVENSRVAITITDLSGKVIQSQTITAQDSKFEVDLTYLSAGVYLMSATSGDVKVIGKVVKK